MRVKWNVSAFEALRKDPAVEADVHRRARAVADAAGEGFEAFPSIPARRRARAAVVPVTVEAQIRNARDNTLLRSLDAGR